MPQHHDRLTNGSSGGLVSTADDEHRLELHC